MTQVQRIISSLMNGKPVCSADRIQFSETAEKSGAVSSDDTLCGAYGRLYIGDAKFCVTEVPLGVFVDLCGVLPDSATSDGVAEYVTKKLYNESIGGVSVEFGGDSMTYLTMNDRLAIVERLNALSPEKRPFCVIFECDYITAEYTMERFRERPTAFFNDGPDSYVKVIQMDLGMADDIEK